MPFSWVAAAPIAAALLLSGVDVARWLSARRRARSAVRLRWVTR